MSPAALEIVLLEMIVPRQLTALAITDILLRWTALSKFTGNSIARLLSDGDLAGPTKPPRIRFSESRRETGGIWYWTASLARQPRRNTLFQLDCSGGGSGNSVFKRAQGL
jgi:hypothetical protein